MSIHQYPNIAGAGGGVTDHGALTGLSDDDHSQYHLLLGRTGGQVLYGGVDPSDSITFRTTSDVTKGDYIFDEMTTAGFLKNTAGGVVTGGNTIDISDDTNLAATSPLSLTGDTLSIDTDLSLYNNATSQFLSSGDNVSELVNDAGYITGYTETQTLQNVTDLGATTTNNITIDNGGLSNNDLNLNGSTHHILRSTATDEFHLLAGGSQRFALTASGEVEINNTYKFPLIDGSNGQVLKTDGAGSLTWQNDNDTSQNLWLNISDGVTSMAATSPTDTLYFVGGNNINVSNSYPVTSISFFPAGSTTQIQFNDSGSLGGDNNFVWDKTNNKLTISNNNASAGIIDIFTPTEDSVCIGQDVGNLTMTGFRNFIAGSSGTGSSITSARNGVMIGDQVCKNTTSSESPMGFGNAALLAQTTGDFNTAFGGITCGWKITSSSYNTFFGGRAAYNQTAGDGVVAIGYYAHSSSLGGNATSSYNVSIGYQSSKLTTTGGQRVSIGYESNGNATSGIGLTSIGYNAGSGFNTDNYSTVVGAGCQTTGSYSNVIVLGYSVNATAANQCVIGNSNGITDFYLGRGVTSLTNAAVTIQNTGISGGNAAGYDLNIGGGKSTGTGIGGSVNLKISKAGVSGSSLNSLTTILSATGRGNIVLGEQAALVTTATDGFVYIPTSAGVPTGTPTSFTGKVAMQYDTSNNKLYIYNGSWKSVTLT